jgi:hypothetical protein
MVGAPRGRVGSPRRLRSAARKSESVSCAVGWHCAVGAVERPQQGWAQAHGSLCEGGGGEARNVAFHAVHSGDAQATPTVAQRQVQLGLRGRGYGEVHGGNVSGGLEDVRVTSVILSV